MSYPYFAIQTSRCTITIYNILSYEILCTLNGHFSGWIKDNVIYRIPKNRGITLENISKYLCI